MDGDRNHNGQQGIRASDTEREQTAEALKQHFLDGRLTSDEYGERLDAAYTARTRAALHALLDDLPPVAGPEPEPHVPGSWWRRLHPAAIVVALLGTLWLAAWLVGGGHPHGFFPLWPLLIWGFFMLRWRPWRLRPRR
ncbi:MAG: DUF1707 SHOCT-like domain-containing protein [Dehalococcoidia bacterium]